MAIDTALFLNHRPDAPPILRIYSWKSPSVSIGRLLPMEIVNLPACYRDGVEVVRRPTGGGAVYHNGDLSFSIICSRNNSLFPKKPQEFYCFTHQRLVSALRSRGIPARLFSPSHHVTMLPSHRFLCFLHPVQGDVMVGGIKVAGGAQCRNRVNWLYQGTLNLNPLPENYLQYFKL